jgi:hypothetical protein
MPSIPPPLPDSSRMRIEPTMFIGSCPTILRRIHSPPHSLTQSDRMQMAVECEPSPDLF